MPGTENFEKFINKLNTTVKTIKKEQFKPDITKKNGINKEEE